MALRFHKKHLDQESQSEYSEQSSATHPTHHLSVYLIAAIASIEGLVFGYDSGAISGAELLLKKAFALTPFAEEFAVSAVIIGALIGSTFGGKLSDMLGRKMTIIVVAFIFGIGAILTAFAPTLQLFIALRILVGVGVGIGLLVVPVYISELSPSSKRGAAVTLNQLALAIGFPIAYLAAFACTKMNLGWRPLFTIEVIPAIVLGIGMLFLPESPRWLASKGRWNEAGHVLERVCGAEWKEDLHAMRNALRAQRHVSVRELFFTGLRMALVVGIGLAIFQQIAGTAAVGFYTPTIFKYIGITSASIDLLLAAAVSIIGMFPTLLAVFLLDRIGVRPLLIGGLIAMAISLFLIGICFAIGTNSTAILILVFLLVYLLAYGIGIGPIFSLETSSIFPTRLRATAVGIAMFFNWLATLLTSLTFLSLINAFGKPVTFWIYAVLAAAAIIFSWFLVPEIRGKSLEQIEEYWDNDMHWVDPRNTGKHISHSQASR